MSAAPALPLQERMTIADRQLALADHVRQWRFAAGLSVQQAARRIPGISHSYVEAIERAAYQPHEIPAGIMAAIIAHAGPLPAALSYYEAPPNVAQRMGDDPDGAGDDVSPVRLSPAPKGPDDGAPIVCMIDGRIALQLSPDRAPLCLLSPDAAARLGTHLIDFANAAGTEAIF